MTGYVLCTDVVIIIMVVLFWHEYYVFLFVWYCYYLFYGWI